MSQELCPICGAALDFPADQNESNCVGCGKTVKRLDAEDYLQKIKAIARVILGQFKDAKVGDRIALEWHITKTSVAIPFHQKHLVKPAMNWLVEINAIKLIISDIQVIEISQTGLSLLAELENQT